MGDLKQQAIEIFLRTLDAIEVKSVFDRKIRVEGRLLFAGESVIDLNRYKEVVAIGLGKASLRMGKALEEALGDRLTRGVLVTSQQDYLSLGPGIEVLVGGHPVPTVGSLRAGERLVRVAESCGSGSLIIFLISGGGSALAECLLAPEILLEDLKSLNQTLIRCGANIREINTVRKAISKIKGGGLGRVAAATGADFVGVYISDVNQGDLRSIASNPVLSEEPAREGALEVIGKYNLSSRLPATILGVLESFHTAPLTDTSRDSILGTVLLCDNRMALECAGRVAAGLGFETHIFDDLVEGDYRDVAVQMIERLSVLRSRFPDMPLCVISGGEVSCVVSGNGVGGRNQEFVLYSATKLGEPCVGTRPIAVLSCGTDGIDGNSLAAGAVSDRHCIEEAITNGIDPGLYLRENDSFSFFSQMGGLLLTGPTGTNVRDIRILLSAPDR